MHIPRDVRRLTDAGLRDLLALVASAIEEVECPSCHASVRVTESAGEAGATSTCPECGGSLTADTSSRSTAQLPTKVESPTVSPARHGKIEIPAQIGKYEIRKVLDKGGFGRVLLAYDTQAKRDVALKTPRLERFGDDPASQSAKQRYVKTFLAEGRRTEGLKHKGIVEVYEVGEDAKTGWAYIAMELVDGGTLYDRMKRDPKLTRDEASRIVSEAAEAVHYAHNRLIYHCDLKPTNILLTKRGHVKVADFGLAIHEDEQLRAECQFAGTLPYMSPEQVDGQRRFLDGRTDVWSLGVILYELLAGRRPFDGADEQGLKNAILAQDFKPLSQRDSRIDPAYDRVLIRCLDRTIAARFHTAGEFSRRLRAAKRRDRVRRFGAQLATRHGIALSLAVILLAGFVVSLIKPTSSSTVPRPYLLDQHAIVNQSHPLFHHRLREFSIQPTPIPTWNQDEKLGWVSMSGRSDDILELGRTDSSDYSISVEISQNDWLGEVGLAVGLDDAHGEHQPNHLVAQVISVNSSHDIEPRVERRLVTYQKIGENWTAIEKVRVAAVEIPKPSVFRFHQLEIEVRERQVFAVFWNRVELPSLVSPESVAMRPVPPVSGGIGIYNFRSSAKFREGTFKYLKKGN